MSTQKNYSPSSLKRLALKGVVRNFFLLRKESFAAATTLSVIAYPREFDNYIRQCLVVNWPGMSQWCAFWVATHWEQAMALPHFVATYTERYPEFMALVAEWRIKLQQTLITSLVIPLNKRSAFYFGKEWVYCIAMQSGSDRVNSPSLTLSTRATSTMPQLMCGFSFTSFKGCPLIYGTHRTLFGSSSRVYLYKDNAWKNLQLPPFVSNFRVRCSVRDEYIVLLSYHAQFNGLSVFIYDFNIAHFVKLKPIGKPPIMGGFLFTFEYLKDFI